MNFSQDTVPLNTTFVSPSGQNIMLKLAVFFAKLKLVMKKVNIVEIAIAQLLLEFVIVGHSKLKKVTSIDRKSLSLVPKVDY